MKPPGTYLAAALAFLALLVPSVRALAADGVQIKEEEGKLRVEVNGEWVTDYCYTGAPHLYYYPLIGPSGLSMTRDFPMKLTAGEEQDHKHHRSLWYSHGDVNGVDFWSEEPKAGRIKHVKFLEIQSGRYAGWIRSSNHWVNTEGGVVCSDVRTFRVYNRPKSERLFDFEITLYASGKDLVLGDTKEGTMAIRLNEALRQKPNKFNQGKPPGSIVQNTGVKDAETWGKRADWCDYHGLIGEKRVGVAIFDHPQNPRHATHWHVRDYGLFAANPFGIHDFEKKPKGAGNLTIPAGRSLSFRYRFYIHEGDTDAAKVADRYREYTAQSPAQF